MPLICLPICWLCGGYNGGYDGGYDGGVNGVSHASRLPGGGGIFYALFLRGEHALHGNGGDDVRGILYNFSNGMVSMVATTQDNVSTSKVTSKDGIQVRI